MKVTQTTLNAVKYNLGNKAPNTTGTPEEEIQAFLLAAIEQNPSALDDIVSEASTSRQTAIKCLQGKANPSLGTIQKIVKALGYELHLSFQKCAAE